MIVRICDICKNPVDTNRYVMKHLKESIINPYTTKCNVVTTKSKIDLCENCFNKFKEFVKNES